MDDNIIQFPSNFRQIDPFEGLSPAEMHEIIYDPFAERKFVSFNRKISPELLLSKSPIYQLAIQYLRLIQAEKEIKLTKTGRLPPKYIKSLYAEKILPDPHIERGITKLSTHSDWIGFSALFYNAELAGLTKKRNDKLSLTAKGNKLLSSLDNDNAMFFLLLETYTTKYNMGCFDGFDENGCGQIGFLFALWLLVKYGEQPQDYTYYAERYLKAYPHFIGEDVDLADYTFKSRFLERFCEYFGFIETVKSYHDKENFRHCWDIKSTELLRALING